MNSSHKVNTEPDRPGRRKPYTKPQVQIYGDLREITQSVGNMGNDDGGSSGMQKTSVA